MAQEEFSSPGGGDTAATLAGIKGINRDSIGTRYDGYKGGVSAPVESDVINTTPRFEVRSIVPDVEADNAGADN